MNKKNKAATVAASTSASADTARKAKDAEGVEVKIEIGAEVEDILAEMCGNFNGDDEAAKLVRGYADRIRKRVAAASEQAAKGIQATIEKHGGLVEAVKAVMAGAEKKGVAWDGDNTESANKVFLVDLTLGPADRLKLGLLAARAKESPEKFLHALLYSRFDQVCGEVFDKSHKPESSNARLQRAYEGLLGTVYNGVCDVGGVARLAFKPAVMP